MFDLPVSTKRQRKSAAKFRNDLLDLGFEMIQFSVYVRYCAGKERITSLASKISKGMPTEGKVDILSVTDKQFQNILSLDSNPGAHKKQPEQLVLF